MGSFGLNIYFTDQLGLLIVTSSFQSDQQVIKGPKIKLIPLMPDRIFNEDKYYEDKVIIYEEKKKTHKITPFL